MIVFKILRSNIIFQASGKTEELLKPANAPSKLLNGPQYKVTADNKSPKIKAKVVTPAQLSKVKRSRCKKKKKKKKKKKFCTM